MNVLEEYQRQVHTAFVIQSKVDPVAHSALGLTGEAGEVADLVKKTQYARPKQYDNDDMLAELGDVLWYLTALAFLHGSSLEEIAKRNIHKLHERHGAPYQPSAVGVPA